MQTWQNWSNDLRMIQFFFLRIEIRYYFPIFLALIFLSRNSADCAQVKVKPTSKNACRSGFCVMLHFQSWLWNKMLSFFEARSRGCPFFTVFMDATWCFVQSCRTSGVQLLRWDSKSAVRFEWKSKKILTQLASKTREWQQGQKVQCKWKGSVSAHVSISFVFSCDFLILSDRANELSSPPAMLNVLPFHCFMSAGLDASHWRQLRLLGGSLWLDRKCVSWLDFMRSVTCRCNMFRTGFDGDLWWSEVLFCFFDDFKPLALLACFAFRSKPYCTLWCKCVDSSKSALSLKACSAHSWHS